MFLNESPFWGKDSCSAFDLLFDMLASCLFGESFLGYVFLLDVQLPLLGFSLPDFSESAFPGLVFLFIFRNESPLWASLLLGFLIYRLRCHFYCLSLNLLSGATLPGVFLICCLGLTLPFGKTFS